VGRRVRARGRQRSASTWSRRQQRSVAGHPLQERHDNGWERWPINLEKEQVGWHTLLLHFLFQFMYFLYIAFYNSGGGPIDVVVGGCRMWLDKANDTKCYTLLARSLSLLWEDGDFCSRWVPNTH
jgi:hypothetical protein